MKKKNFIVGFSAAFAAILTLASCGGLRAKDGVVLTINGKAYTAEELFLDQKTPAAAEAKFNAVYKVAVRRYFEDGQDGHQYVTEITRDTKNKISGSKAEAQSNASKNGTSYDTEWNKILKNNNVEKESELYDKYEYDLMKSKFEEVIYEYKRADKKTNYDVLRNGGHLFDRDGNEHGKDGKNIKGYLKHKLPYHIKHILVKVDAKNDDDITGEITAAQAKKIYDVVTELAKGTDFGKVAYMYSDDTESAKKNGELGIMSTETGYVNDFKLGVYLYESYFSNLTNKNPIDQDGKLGKYNATKAETVLFGEGKETAKECAEKIKTLIDPTSSNTNNVLGRIPYGVIKQLGETTVDDIPLYDVDLNKESTVNGKTRERFKNIIDDVKPKYYPRNVLFNKYFNKHNIMVITANDGPSDAIQTDVNKYITGTASEQTRTRNNGNDDLFYGSPMGGTLPAGFTRDAKNQDSIMINSALSDEHFLRDEKGRIILVFKSGNATSSNDATTYQGIHFVVIERSPFVDKEWDDNSTDGTSNKWTTLNEYYTQYYPNESNDDHPTYTGKSATSVDDYKKTYTSFTVRTEETTQLKTRADTVKKELKSGDACLNTYIYEYLLDKGQISFNKDSKMAENIETSINNWINITKRDGADLDENKKWNDTWETYYNNLNARTKNRAFVSIEGQKGCRLIPEVCVKGFLGTLMDKQATPVAYTVEQLFSKKSQGGIFND